MSRSGYSDDWPEDNSGWLYRGAVLSALKGKRGQAFLKEMLAALDAMPVKELIAGDLQDGDKVCAIGAVGRARGIDMTNLDPEDSSTVAAKFGIASAMARELVFENDDDLGFRTETPAQRFERMRRWVADEITPDVVGTGKD
jgi:hypothetical protein